MDVLLIFLEVYNTNVLFDLYKATLYDFFVIISCESLGLSPVIAVRVS